MIPDRSSQEWGLRCLRAISAARSREYKTVEAATTGILSVPPWEVRILCVEYTSSLSSVQSAGDLFGTHGCGCFTVDHFDFVADHDSSFVGGRVFPHRHHQIFALAISCELYADGQVAKEVGS
jgi:hypothetical protein